MAASPSSSWFGVEEDVDCTGVMLSVFSRYTPPGAVCAGPTGAIRSFLVMLTQLRLLIVVLDGLCLRCTCTRETKEIVCWITWRHLTGRQAASGLAHRVRTV